MALTFRYIGTCSEAELDAQYSMQPNEIIHGVPVDTTTTYAAIRNDVLWHAGRWDYPEDSLTIHSLEQEMAVIKPFLALWGLADDMRHCVTAPAGTQVWFSLRW